MFCGARARILRRPGPQGPQLAPKKHFRSTVQGHPLLWLSTMASARAQNRTRAVEGGEPDGPSKVNDLA